MLKRLLTGCRIAVAAMMIAACGVVPALQAQVTAPLVFIKSPASVLPTLDKNTRLDMVDYFKGGMATASPTSLNGEARVTSMSDRQIEFTTSENGRMSMSPVKYGRDTVIVVVKTIDLPAPDSRVELYSWPGWNLIDSKDSGVVADWVTPAARKDNRTADVENALNFMTASATFDPETSTIVFVPTVAAVVSDKEYEKVSPYIHREMAAKVRAGKGIVPDKTR